jgi:hypothetical protein
MNMDWQLSGFWKDFSMFSGTRGGGRIRGRKWRRRNSGVVESLKWWRPLKRDIWEEGSGLEWCAKMTGGRNLGIKGKENPTSDLAYRRRLFHPRIESALFHPQTPFSFHRPSPIFSFPSFTSHDYSPPSFSPLHSLSHPILNPFSE